MQDTDAAYLAGLVDGEGSVMLYRRRDVVAVRLAVANTHRGVLDWIVDTTDVGKVHNQYPERPSTIGDRTFIRKATFAWTCNADAAESVLQQLLPYMQIKPAQAELAIATQRALRDPAKKADRFWQEENWTAMKLMNKRGAS